MSTEVVVDAVPRLVWMLEAKPAPKRGAIALLTVSSRCSKAFQKDERGMVNAVAIPYVNVARCGVVHAVPEAHGGRRRVWVPAERHLAQMPSEAANGNHAAMSSLPSAVEKKDARDRGGHLIWDR